ncbi:MAG TPA: SLC13 family permease [Sulfolobales archaeon]|nr:SLC13 family permease [Sulfolobales archaeon]
MESGFEFWLVWIIFGVSIALIVSRRVEEPLAGLLGVSLLLMVGLVGLGEAFGSMVDWNIIAILLGMWMISYHMVEAGLPQRIVNGISRYIKTSRDAALLLSIVAGFISTVVDNVLVVLLLVPIAIRIARAYGIDPLATALLVTLTANATGTALLLGDLPPQLLHSVFGAEFIDFIYMMGRPSSFPILMVSILAALYISTKILVPEKRIEQKVEIRSSNNDNKGYLVFSLVMFFTAILLMSFRKEISMAIGRDIPLGVFPLTVGIIGSMLCEKLYGRRFGEVVEKGIDWGSILFYLSLFILVGSLEKHQGLEPISVWLSGLMGDVFLGYTAIYWISAPIVAFVEHDAYILIMLRSIKDANIENPWPFAWSLLWSGTLGSNYTAAGAPALYVALRIIERETGLRIRPKAIYRVTLTYATINLVITYLISTPIWASV